MGYWLFNFLRLFLAVALIYVALAGGPEWLLIVLVFAVGLGLLYSFVEWIATGRIK